MSNQAASCCRTKEPRSALCGRVGSTAAEDTRGAYYGLVARVDVPGSDSPANVRNSTSRTSSGRAPADSDDLRPRQHDRERVRAAYRARRMRPLDRWVPG